MRLGGASVTLAIENELVIVEFEAGWDHVCELIWTALDIKNTSTGFAMEVVVVSDICPFVACVVAWELKCGEPAFVNE